MSFFALRCLFQTMLLFTAESSFQVANVHTWIAVVVLLEAVLGLVFEIS